MNTPHKHAEFIHAWADGKEIEQRNPTGGQYGGSTVPGLWERFDETWREEYEYRIKPTAPVVRTKMTDGEMEAVFIRLGPACHHIVGRRALANAAIARAIADEQVVTMKDHLDSLATRLHELQLHEAALRAQRDMAVAKAVRTLYEGFIDGRLAGTTDAELVRVISEVKP